MIIRLLSMSSPFGFLLSAEEPSRRTGAIVAVGAVALCTLILYPLKQIAPVVSLGVVYMLAVLVVSVVWGAWLGFATAVQTADRMLWLEDRVSSEASSGSPSCSTAHPCSLVARAVARAKSVAGSSSKTGWKPSSRCR